jgi:hypothetical protein
MLVLLRLISLILVVAAIMLIGADIVTSLEHGGKIMVRSLDQVFALFDKAGMASFDAWTTAHLPGFLDAAIKGLLGFWSWAVLGIPGIILAFVFGRRTADVG